MDIVEGEIGTLVPEDEVEVWVRSVAVFAALAELGVAEVNFLAERPFQFEELAVSEKAFLAQKLVVVAKQPLLAEEVLAAEKKSSLVVIEKAFLAGQPVAAEILLSTVKDLLAEEVFLPLQLVAFSVAVY